MSFLLEGGSQILLFVVVVVVIWLLSSIKILNEYERAVVFRLGRLLDVTKGPGVAPHSGA
jgi:regulator of protease activity HflC (stomatin/prohibitin superfamily)